MLTTAASTTTAAATTVVSHTARVPPARQLGLPQPILHVRQMSRHARGDYAAVPRAVVGIGGQAVPGQVIRSGSAPQRSSRANACSSSPVAAWINIASADRPVNGGSPVRISHRMAPGAKTSARLSTCVDCPAACSGACRPGFPSPSPACDRSTSTPLRAVATTVSSVDPCPPWRRRPRRPAAAPWPAPSPSPAPRRSSRPSRSTASDRGGSRRGRAHRRPSGRRLEDATGSGAGCQPQSRARQQLRERVPLDQLHGEERPEVRELPSS